MNSRFQLRSTFDEIDESYKNKKGKIKKKIAYVVFFNNLCKPGIHDRHTETDCYTIADRFIFFR